MAADGRTNREIAEALFVTVKAVTYHLTNCYRKLDIAGRDQLAAALSGQSGRWGSSGWRGAAGQGAAGTQAGREQRGKPGSPDVGWQIESASQT